MVGTFQVLEDLRIVTHARFVPLLANATTKPLSVQLLIIGVGCVVFAPIWAGINKMRRYSTRYLNDGNPLDMSRKAQQQRILYRTARKRILSVVTWCWAIVGIGFLIAGSIVGVLRGF